MEFTRSPFRFLNGTPSIPSFPPPAAAVRSSLRSESNPSGAQEVFRELISRNFIVDYRPGAGIRVAPTFKIL